MSCNWMRRGLLALASLWLVTLAACGSGTIESQLVPSRVITFGDGMADMGQTGARYTVNDNSLNIWTQQVALNFGLDLAPVATGGTAYATGNARVALHPDAAGNAATPTVAEQIDTFLAANTLGANDLVIINAGTADVVAEMGQMTSGAQTGDQMMSDVRQAGRDLAAQVRRLVGVGAKQVVVVGPYHLGRTPWGVLSAQPTLLTEASSKFNEELLVAMVDLGANVLYVDAALLYNLMISNPGAYGFTNAIDAVCTSVDPGPGIGIGPGQVNSKLCTTATLVPGADYNAFMFADAVYASPQAHRKFAEFAFTRIRNRW